MFVEVTGEKLIGKAFLSLIPILKRVKIRENKSRAKCEIYSKLTIKTAE